MNRYIKTLLIILSLFLLIPASIAQEYSGKVVGIADGDTFTFLTGDKQQVKVCLAEIEPRNGRSPMAAEPGRPSRI